MPDHHAESRDEPIEVATKADQPKTYKTADIRDHSAELDALRGIAIIGVLIAHLTGQWKAIIGSMQVPLVGEDFLYMIHFIRGVPLFFLLSGYLLTWTEGVGSGVVLIACAPTLSGASSGWYPPTTSL